MTFAACELGDARRTKRLVRLAEQVAARPDGSTPEQTEAFADCKAACELKIATKHSPSLWPVSDRAT